MRIENLCKSYKNTAVFENFCLDIEENKITCILGESGSGKTTLLNVLAGLTPYQGTVPRTKCSYIFQEPRLVPNLTVFDNLRLVCGDGQKISDYLDRAGLKDKAKAYPVSLSGGQAQRVAILRAFLFGAETLLMDEPFSSLDLSLKVRMMDMFRELWKSDNRTCLFVTHDIDEAVYLSDRIILLDGGRIRTEFNLPFSEERRFGENGRIRSEILQAILSSRIL